MSDRKPDANGSSDPEIKVTDRRQFTAEGERIVGGAEPEVTAPGPEPTGKPELPAGASFDGLVMGLVGTALMHLGEMPDPAGQAGTVNLAAAREAIDLLGILQDKTAGNLASEEQQFLDHWLSSLRLLFTQKVRSG